MIDARLLWVACGGAAGSVLRYVLAGWANGLAHSSFPAGTVLVNLLGALAIGALAACTEIFNISPQARLLLQAGVLGGFTTFSAFGLETFSLLRNGDGTLALANIAITNIAGIGCVALGFVAARAVLH